jgi:cytoskeleton protein RodZ
VELDVNEIGSGLRAARERLGLTLEQAQADTRIRARYLDALEDERYDVLPAEAYVRGFLRCYASYLGLDAQRYLSAYRAQAPSEDPPIAPTAATRRGRSRTPLVAAGALAVALAVVLGAWKLDRRLPEAAPPPAPSPAPVPAPAPRSAPAATPAPAPAPVHLVLTTEGGDCWLDVRIGGPDGRPAWSGTLREGRTLRLGLGKPLFVRAGAPHVLRATIGGEAAPLPAGANALVFTRQGARPAG